MRGDGLPPAVALVIFDAAVNSGVRAATIWLQKAVRERADAVIGPKTLPPPVSCAPSDNRRLGGASLR